MTSYHTCELVRSALCSTGRNQLNLKAVCYANILQKDSLEQTCQHLYSEGMQTHAPVELSPNN